MSPYRVFLLLLILAAGGGGFFFGKKRGDASIVPNQANQNFPLTEYKCFAVVVYACNQAAWCERGLRSILEQDYDHYRIVFIDDASNDGTYEKARDFVIENNAEKRVILIRNETRLGPARSLYRAVGGCLDREVAFPLDAKDWLAHPLVLSQMNIVYQNPDVWLASARAVEYPSYSILEAPALEAPCTFYAGLMKKIRIEELTEAKKSYSILLRQLSGKHSAVFPKPALFYNTAVCLKDEN